MRDILLIFIVLVCSAVALRRPDLGIIFFIGMGFLNMHTWTWSVGQSFPFALIIGASTVIGIFFWKEKKRIPVASEVLLLLALWVTFGVSSLLAIYPDIAIPRFIDVSKILFSVILVLIAINNERRLKTLFYVIGLSLGIFGLKGGIFSILTGGNYTVLGPGESFIGSNNSIGLALAMNVPILFFLQKTEKRKYLRILLWAMILFSYPAVVFTYSRGAWIGLSLVTVILFLKSKAMVRITTVGIIVASLLIPLSMEYLPERLSNRYDTLVNYKEEGSAQSRFWNWEFSWRVGLANPLHGGGFNYYSEENYARYYPEFLERWPGKVWSSHSVWFTLFGEHGFPGLFLGVMLVGSCFYSTIRIRSQGKLKANTLWILPYADMLQVSLIAWTAVGTFYDAAYFDLFYYLVAAIVIMKGILKKETFTGGVRLEKSIATGTSHWSSQRPETGLSGTTN